jgi:hypothetical protein
MKYKVDKVTTKGKKRLTTKRFQPKKMKSKKKKNASQMINRTKEMRGT